MYECGCIYVHSDEGYASIMYVCADVMFHASIHVQVSMYIDFLKDLIGFCLYGTAL